MAKALSELMQRHGQTLPAPALVPLSEPSMPMLLSGLATTLDTDIERVQFAPFAVDPLPENVPLHYDHRLDQRAGHIETLAFSDKGELMVCAYVDHPAAVRCNAWSVSGDVLEFSLHDSDRPSFFARIEKIRLREISLVPNPIQARARVLHRSKPGPASCFVAETIKGQDLMIKKMTCLTQYVELLQQIVRQQTEAQT
jgi:hypothetical protein